jgi:hypothetical protein
MTTPVTMAVDDPLQSLNTEALVRGSHREGWLKFLEAPLDFSTEHFEFFIEDGYGKPHGPFIFSGRPEAGCEQ